MILTSNIHFSHNVAILPFLVKNDQLYLLGQIKDQDLRSVSGKIKKKESPIYTVKRELFERFDLVIKSSKLHYIGDVIERGEQWLCTQRLFIVDFTNKIKDIDSDYIWITPETLSESKDPLLHSMFLKGVDKRLFRKSRCTEECEVREGDVTS